MKRTAKARQSKINRYMITSLLIILIGGALGIWELHNRVNPPVLPVPPLKQLAAKRSIELGNFAIESHLKDKPYTNILTSQFSFALADNTPNWYFTDGGLRPSPTTFDFRHMDEVVSFAEANHMPVQAHHYVWGEQKWLPNWLVNGNYNQQQLMDIMHNHIMTVGQHYAGHIAEWTVVNEAFTRSEHLYNLHDWWADHTGGDGYIDSAFRWARQADPRSKLILNDFHNETINQTSNAMYDYIKAALGRGVPIDGIGMQMHLDGVSPPSKQAVIENMQRFAALGVGVYVTEFDVNMSGAKGRVEQKNQQEGKVYYDMIRACIESKVCHSFAFLGITDKETWYNYVGASNAMPLMFDKKYQPKPSYYSVRSALQLD
jgi:endo-1,4-beta-xylanase